MEMDLGDWFGAEDGGWDLVLLCSGLQHLERIFLLGGRVAAWEVGAPVRKQGLLGVEHVFHPGRQGFRFSSPKPPLRGFLH